ncbi:Expansin-B5 [Entamoeba marina]
MIFGLFVTLVYSLVPSTNDYLSPLSNCTLGRVSYYENYTGNAACGFGNVPTLVTSGYFFRTAVNTAFYNKASQCGICYELVGPHESIRVIVSDECPNSTNELCNGDMLHFDVAMNAFPFLVDLETGIVNVTFRMVSCDITGNIQIHSFEGNNPYYFAFIITNHVIGVKTVEVSFDNGTTFSELNRTDYNAFIVESEEGIQLPFDLKITSIANDSILTTIESTHSDYYQDTGYQFEIPPETFFNVESLESFEKPNDFNVCCSKPEELSIIYDDDLRGILSEYYEYLSLYIKSNDTGAQLEVKKLIEDISYPFESYIINITNTDWIHVVITLNELGINIVDKELIYGFELVNLNGNATYLLDEIKLIRSSVTTAVCADRKQPNGNNCTVQKSSESYFSDSTTQQAISYSGQLVLIIMTLLLMMF